MDCLEFRRRLAAEPDSNDPAMLAHRRDCPACAAAWERARQFERSLAEALAVPVPDGLAERVLLAQATGERRRHRGRRRLALALAASLLVAAVGADLAWRHFDARSLPALAVAHMPDEIDSLQRTRPIADDAVAAGFAARGLKLAGPVPDNVTYVHDCDVGPYRTVHLVSRVGATSVAVLYIPGRHMRNGRSFRRDGWRGREVPLREGTLVMLSDRRGVPLPFDAVARSWRTAIDGPADPAQAPLAP